jgi:hypothetical protein
MLHLLRLTANPSALPIPNRLCRKLKVHVDGPTPESLGLPGVQSRDQSRYSAPANRYKSDAIGFPDALPPLANPQNVGDFQMPKRRNIGASTGSQPVLNFIAFRRGFVLEAPSHRQRAVQNEFRSHRRPSLMRSLILSPPSRHRFRCRLHSATALAASSGEWDFTAGTSRAMGRSCLVMTNSAPASATRARSSENFVLASKAPMVVTVTSWLKQTSRKLVLCGAGMQPRLLRTFGQTPGRRGP